MRVAGLATTAAGTPAARPATTGTTAATARTPAAATGATGASLGVRDLDRDPATVELATIQLRDRVLRVLRRRHLDEPEAAGLSGEAIRDHRRRQHVTA